MKLVPSVRSTDSAARAVSPTLRHNQDFLLLWAGQSISNVGDWINFVAITVLVYQLTGSGLSLGVLRATHAAPELILGALAGVYVDRWDRKSTMIAADLMRAVLVALMAISPNVVEIYALSLGVNLASIFFGPAKSATIPNLVAPDTLTRANGLSSTSQTLAMAFGSSIGGIAIAAFGLRQAFYLDAASFLVSATCIAFIRVRRTTVAGGKHTAFWTQFSGGWDAVRSHPLRRGITVMASLLVLGPGVSTVLAVVLAESVLNGGAAGYSLIVSAMGAGAVVGAVSVSVLGGRLPREATFRVGFVLAALGTALLGVSRSLPIAAAAFALIGGGQIVANVSGITLLQEHTDDQVRGRVFGIYQTVVHVCSLLAAGIAGGLADPLGAATVIVGVGALEICLSPLSLVLVRERRAKGGVRIEA
jgi:DHA3 family macrolide efflux protein-like MFS transporter